MIARKSSHAVFTTIGLRRRISIFYPKEIYKRPLEKNRWPVCIIHSARAKNAVGQRHKNYGLKWERAIGQRMFKRRCSKKTK